jgi:hypothetical protein
LVSWTKWGFARAARCGALLAGLLCGTLPAHAEPKPYALGPVPAWVQVQPVDMVANVPADQVAGGTHFVLVDYQTRIDGGDRSFYRHFASKALTAEGVASIANIELRFDPSYQKLVMHSINVRRGAQVIAKLPTAQVRLLQREAELESLIFDGTQSASVFLDDVRVGDVVEYAYSVQGSNPVFGGQQFGRFDLQWAVPVARAHARIVAPAGRELQIQRHNSAEAPVVTVHGNQREYRWSLSHVPALQVEKSAPDWFDPYPAVSWGEFKNWRAVVDWALPLYRLPEAPAAAVQAVADEIARAHQSPALRLVATLRHVQGQVRYLGVEVGVNSHAPHAPETVLANRFGDCKDKSLLTVALLRAQGIQASPALVNSRQRKGINDWQPSPSAFNHVVVQAKLSGKTYWFDPTRSPQSGDLDHLVQADYGPALVIDTVSSALVPMAGDVALSDQREVQARFDARAGLDKPVGYTVTTVAQGAAADRLRNTLASRSRDQLQKEYLNFYAGHFTGVSASAPLEVQDDEANNRLTVIEHYSIHDFWQRNDKRQRLEATVAVPELSDLLRLPATQVRHSPLALSHPVDLLHVTTVLLPGEWDLQPDSFDLVDPVFELHRKQTWKDNTLVLTDHYVSLQSEVAAAAMPAYVANLDKARQELSYLLYRNDDHPATTPKPAPAFSPHWLPAVLAVLLLQGMAWAAWRLWHWNPAPWPGRAPQPLDPEGLAGWLILVGLSLLIGVVRTARVLWDSRQAYGVQGWPDLTVPGGAHFSAWWWVSLVAALAGNLALLTGQLVAIRLYLARRSSFPRVYLGLMAGSLALVLLDWLVSVQVLDKAELGAALKQALIQLGSLVLWGSYFARSRRARATFVVPANKPAQTAPLEPADTSPLAASPAGPQPAEPVSATPPAA